MRTIEQAAIDYTNGSEYDSERFIAGAEFGVKNFIEFCEENYSIVIPEFLIKEYFKSV